MGKLYNFQYDFEKQVRNYLVFSNAEGFNIKQFNNIQLKMLLSNNIPNLIPLELEEMDFIIKLRYDVTSKRTLASYFKLRELNIKDRLQIFLNIISIINDSKTYMLDEKNYIIHQDFIFIDTDTSNIFFAYLPFKKIPDKESTRIELKRLFIYFFNNFHNIDVNLYNTIINYLEGDNFNISNLKQKFLLILNPNDYLYKNCLDNKINEVKKDKKSIDDKSLQSLTSLHKTLLFSLSFLLIAILWSTYFNQQKEEFYYINLGLTILIMDFVYVFLKIWRPKLRISTGYKATYIKKRKSKKEAVDRTNYIVEAEETVLLKRNNKKIYLEVNRETEVEKIDIDSKNFIIGRNPSTVNYFEKSSEISRVHIEIINDSEDYLVRDLGSKNGSYLNGSELIANKIYSIKDGDVLKLANTEFKIREVSII